MEGILDKTKLFFDPILEPKFTKMVVGSNVIVYMLLFYLCNFICIYGSEIYLNPLKNNQKNQTL